MIFFLAGMAYAARGTGNEYSVLDALNTVK